MKTINDNIKTKQSLTYKEMLILTLLYKHYNLKPFTTYQLKQILQQIPFKTKNPNEILKDLKDKNIITSIPSLHDKRVKYYHYNIDQNFINLISQIVENYQQLKQIQKQIDTLEQQLENKYNYTIKKVYTQTK